MDMDMDMSMNDPSLQVVGGDMGGNSSADELCDGSMAMSMLMDGFGASWGKSVSCTIFLFKNYELNTVPTLLSGYAITLLLGIVVHLLGYSRLKIQGGIATAGTGKRVLQSFLYTLQVGAGYLLMLIAMTYRADLFGVTLLGLFIGHLIFHSKICCVHRPQPVKPRVGSLNGDGEGENCTSSYQDLESPQARTVTAVTQMGVEDMDPCCAQLDVEIATPRVQSRDAGGRDDRLIANARQLS